LTAADTFLLAIHIIPHDMHSTVTRNDDSGHEQEPQFNSEIISIHSLAILTYQASSMYYKHKL